MNPSLQAFLQDFDLPEHTPPKYVNTPAYRDEYMQRHQEALARALGYRPQVDMDAIRAMNLPPDSTDPFTGVETAQHDYKGDFPNSMQALLGIPSPNRIADRPILSSQHNSGPIPVTSSGSSPHELGMATGSPYLSAASRGVPGSGSMDSEIGVPDSGSADTLTDPLNSGDFNPTPGPMFDLGGYGFPDLATLGQDVPQRSPLAAPTPAFSPAALPSQELPLAAPTSSSPVSFMPNDLGALSRPPNAAGAGTGAPAAAPKPPSMANGPGNVPPAGGGMTLGARNQTPAPVPAPAQPSVEDDMEAISRWRSGAPAQPPQQAPIPAPPAPAKPGGNNPLLAGTKATAPSPQAQQPAQAPAPARQPVRPGGVVEENAGGGYGLNRVSRPGGGHDYEDTGGIFHSQLEYMRNGRDRLAREASTGDPRAIARLTSLDRRMKDLQSRTFQGMDAHGPAGSSPAVDAYRARYQGYLDGDRNAFNSNASAETLQAERPYRQQQIASNQAYRRDNQTLTKPYTHTGPDGEEFKVQPLNKLGMSKYAFLGAAAKIVGKPIARTFGGALVGGGAGWSADQVANLAGYDTDFTSVGKYLGAGMGLAGRGRSQMIGRAIGGKTGRNLARGLYDFAKIPKSPRSLRWRPGATSGINQALSQRADALAWQQGGPLMRNLGNQVKRFGYETANLPFRAFDSFRSPAGQMGSNWANLARRARYQTNRMFNPFASGMSPGQKAFTGLATAGTGAAIMSDTIRSRVASEVDNMAQRFGFGSADEFLASPIGQMMQGGPQAGWAALPEETRRALTMGGMGVAGGLGAMAMGAPGLGAAAALGGLGMGGYGLMAQPGNWQSIYSQATDAARAEMEQILSDPRFARLTPSQQSTVMQQIQQQLGSGAVGATAAG